MLGPAPHILLRRRIKGLVLAVLFLAMNLVPLAGAAMRSPVVMHAVTGECTGDCATCGCSVERQERRICCCWQNRFLSRESGEHHDDCCPESKGKQAAPRISRICPCGSGTHIGLTGEEEIGLLVPNSIGTALSAGNPAHPAYSPHPPDNRHREPPDPPPEVRQLVVSLAAQ